MFDSKKIDIYFEGKNSIASRKTRNNGTEFSWSRFIKLVFPCVAAAIFGLMVVLPNIKKSADISDEITLPRKSEMEKLHVEKVFLNTTDKKNRVSSVRADNMDETDTDSNEIKINNPRADVPSDNGNINIVADTGFVNQNTKILRLEQNVVVKDEQNNVLHTQQAIYDFTKEYGYGNSDVFAQGDWGKLSSQGFTYDKNSEVLTLSGATLIETKNGTLESQTQTEYYQNENKIVSLGNAVVKKDDKTLKADKIVNYLTSGSKKELEKTEAFDNVNIITPKGTVKGNRAEYDMNSGAAKVFGNVVIISEKGTAKGDHAVYDSIKNTVDLYGEVVLEQGNNFIRGKHVHADLNTSIITMVSDKKQGGRVSGTFYKK
jgi:LPS export ABC transporter protein LptC